MKFSKAKIIVFFLVLIILGWMLYPRELFMAYILEGKKELKESEIYYQKYLEKKPFNKFATLRLAGLYERLGEPEKATPLLKELVHRREADWSVAEKYLEHIKNLGDEKALYDARLEIAHNFLAQPRFPKDKIEELLYDAYRYDLWHQQLDKAYEHLLELIRIAKHPKQFQDDLEALDWGLAKTDVVLATLQKKLAVDSKNKEARQNLVDIYAATGKLKEALELVEEGLKLFPNDGDFLELRVFVHDKSGNYDEAIQDLEFLLAGKSTKMFDEEDKTDMLSQLAGFYAKKKENQKALEIYKQVLARDNTNSQNWMNVFYMLNDLKRTDEALELLKKYLAVYPEETDKEKTLAELYLYEKRDSSQMGLYSKFINNVQFATDVGGLLVDQKKYREALDWMEKVEKRHPNNLEINLKIAEIYVLLFENKQAEKYFDKVVALKPSDETILKRVGKEMFFLGRLKKGIAYLEEAGGLKNEDPEVWFWLSEIYYSQNRKKKGREASQKVVNRIEEQKNISEELTRIGLKSRGRLHFTPAIQREYALDFLKYPKNFELRADLVDLLIDNKKLDAAEQRLAQMKPLFPEEKTRLESYEVRIAFDKKQWDQAIPILQNLIQEQPKAWAHRMDLGQAYLNSGHWKKAIEEYQIVQEKSEEPKSAKQALRDLHEKYDNRVTPSFRYMDFGGDKLNEWEIATHQYLTEMWELHGEGIRGHFESPGIGFAGNAYYGKILLANHSVQNWTFQGGTGFGTSHVRSTIAPSALIAFHPDSAFSLQGSYDYRTLRVDIPQGVAAGNLVNVAKLNWQYNPIPRLTFAGLYEFDQNSISGGLKAEEHIVEPSLNYQFFKNPNFVLGYLYTFSKVSDKNGFLNVVPLIPEVNAHYLTGSLSHRPVENLYLEARGFIGGDTVRHLHFFEAALWGAGASMTWGIDSWLDLAGSYDYGKEVLTTLSGESHNARITLSGHW